MIILALAISLLLFLMYSSKKRTEPKYSYEESDYHKLHYFSGDYIEIKSDYLKLGTDIGGCGGIVIGNPSDKPITLRASRWWWDSNTFIDEVGTKTLNPQEYTHQNFGWAGFGAKEYRVYFYDNLGRQITTDNIAITNERTACSESNDLGLNS